MNGEAGCDSCSKWIQTVPVPGKVIILKCTRCATSYTLFPNGQIAYEMPANATTLLSGPVTPN